MRRVVSVWLPHWPTDRLRRTSPDAPPPETPLVTAAQDGNRRVVAAVDPAAAALGLRPGLAVVQAMAVVPGLVVAESDPAADSASLERLARWCHRMTPLAAADGADGLWLDVAGCTHLWGGEAEMLAQIEARLAQDGVAARAAIADAPGAAHAMARHGGEDRIVPPGAQAERVARLPVEALRLPAEMSATLRRLGFEQVGHLARVPRALLARRFGAALGLRLDQAHGTAPEPLQPLPPEATLQHRVTFLEPLLTAEALAEATRHVLEPVCAEMERAGLGARRVDLLFERVDGGVQATRVGTARPNRQPGHLARLLNEHLDQVDPGLGIEAMRVVVPLAEGVRWRQEDGADVSTLVDRLANRLGAERVYRVAPMESDVPERAVARAAVGEASPGRQGAKVRGGRRKGPHPDPLPKGEGDAEGAGGGWGYLSPCPTRLLDPPHKVEAIAELPDHAPAAFTWRRRRHRVRRADGPERIYGEWWKRDAETAAVRDYFRVEDQDGRRFLLYREGDGVDRDTGGLGWFLQGVF